MKLETKLLKILDDVPDNIQIRAEVIKLKADMLRALADDLDALADEIKDQSGAVMMAQEQLGKEI